MSGILSAIPEEWRDRALYLMAGGLLASLGVGWSDLYRDDPYYGEQGRALAARVSELEDSQPETYPPPEWVVWRADITGKVNVISSRDSNMEQDIQKVFSNCEKHNTEAESWKQRIIVNEQWIQYFKGERK